MKRKSTLTAFISLVIFSLLSFSTPSEKTGIHLKNYLSVYPGNKITVWIYFTDKGPGASGKLINPSNLVSQRSLQRRMKVKNIQNIVDMTDVPVYDNYVSGLNSLVRKIRIKSKWLNAVSAEIDRSLLRDISELDFVKKIDIVETFRKSGINPEFTIEKPENYPNLPAAVYADSLNYGTGSSLAQITQIKVNEVHNDGIFGQGILIASFDAGFFNLTHEVFTTYPMNIISTYDFQNHTPVLTGHSHGTATLSLVGGYKPGQLIGPAFKSDFILARTEVDPTETPVEMDNWIAAAEWADSLGADVITSSLGYLDFDAPYTSYTWLDMNGNTLPITKVADLAVNKGIVVSNSAGNNGSDVHNTIIGPADGDSVITVGAVTSAGTRAGFSSVGPTTDIPSRFKPDVAAMGSNNYVAGTSGNTYYNGSGTSFSCPINSGVCALILSANKNLTPIQVRDILRKFGSNNGSPDNLTGWGIINAKKSVDTARKLDTTPPLLEYTQLFRIIHKPAPVKIMCKISDNGIIRNRLNEAPLLYYRKYINGVWSSFTAVNFYLAKADSFYFSIPASTGKALVEYYIAAQDIALPSPLVSTLPAGGSGVNPPGSNPPALRFSYKVDTYNSPGAPAVKDGFSTEIYPNPFNPKTKINFSLPQSCYVTLKIYDIEGREISALANGFMQQGEYSEEFGGGNLSSGVYFCRLTAVNSSGSEIFSGIKQMILLK